MKLESALDIIYDGRGCHKSYLNEEQKNYIKIHHPDIFEVGDGVLCTKTYVERQKRVSHAYKYTPVRAG